MNTLAELTELLAAVCSEVWELAAPAGVKRGIIWHRYGRCTVLGDDMTFRIGAKAQIDILVNSAADTLPDDVCAALETAGQPYDFIDEAYDDEYAAVRTILQLEVR